MRQTEVEQKTAVEEKRRSSKLRLLVVPVAGFLIFSLGFAVGNGDVRLGIGPGSQNLPPKLDYSSVNQLYGVLAQDFDGSLDKTKLLDGVKGGLVEAAGDPYTEYFNPEAAKEFQDSLSGSFSGIGAELGTNEEGNIVIVSPLSGYPAEKAGLKPKDVVAAIDDQTTRGLSISAAVRKIRGAEGTSVKLTIVRGAATPFEVTITRAKITVPSVEHRVEGNIGYLKINQFSSDTASLAKKAAQEFKNQNVKAVALDLRGNPGGFLEGAVDISSLWLDKGKTVVEERRGGQVKSVKQAKGDNLLKGLPTVVLINEGSASASEIVAGALRDQEVATLVGVKTFGKGSVQQVEQLADGAELKVTVARWYTPKGKNIDKQGITPDVTVENTDEDEKAKRDPQKDRATQLLQQKIR